MKARIILIFVMASVAKRGIYVYNILYGVFLTFGKVKIYMAANYNKLWKLMIDRNLKKKDLLELAGLSTNVVAKMGKGGDVSTQVLRKICAALDCRVEDIVDFGDK